MIRISCGKYGSGKSLGEVVTIINERQGYTVYTNIETDLPNCVLLQPEMIIKKSYDSMKKRNIYDVNKEFWQEQKGKICIVLDESMDFLDARASLTNISRAVTRFQNAIRRIVNQVPDSHGELVYIIQNVKAIDERVRSACTQFRHYVGHYIKRCAECDTRFYENTEMSEQAIRCRNCGSSILIKEKVNIEYFKFDNYEKYLAWLEKKEKTYYENVVLSNPQKYWNRYKTLSWANVFQNW